MAVGAMTFSERKAMKALTVTITIRASRCHRLSKRFGLWLMKVGGRVAGIGCVCIEDEVTA